MELRSDALGELMAHDQRGNVRELKHAVERAMLNATGRIITRADVRLALPGGREARGPVPADTFARRRLEQLLLTHEWDTAKIANVLGVHRGTVYRQINRLGLQGPKGPAVWDAWNATMQRGQFRTRVLLGIRSDFARIRTSSCECGANDRSVLPSTTCHTAS